MLESFTLRPRNDKSTSRCDENVPVLQREMPSSRHISDLDSRVDLMIVAANGSKLSTHHMQAVIQRSGVHEIFTFNDEWVNPIRKTFPVNIETTVDKACPRVDPKMWCNEAFQTHNRDSSGWMVLSAASRRIGHTLTFREHGEIMQAVLEGRDTPLIHKLRRGLKNVRVAYLHDAEDTDDPNWMGWYILDWLLVEPGRKVQRAAQIRARQESMLLLVVVVTIFVAAVFAKIKIKGKLLKI